MNLLLGVHWIRTGAFKIASESRRPEPQLNQITQLYKNVQNLHYTQRVNDLPYDLARGSLVSEND